MTNLLKQKGIFTTLLSVVAPIYQKWPVQIKVEGDFSVRTWMMPKQRRNMGLDMFGAIMRIHSNSPRDKDDDYKEFIAKSVVNWNKMKNRNHKIGLLDKLANLCDQQVNQNKSVLELLNRLKQSG